MGVKNKIHGILVEKRIVFVIYDYSIDASQTQVQKKTNKLVDRIKDIYSEKCLVNKYMHDYKPGSNIFEERSHLCNSSHMICVIMTKESINSKMLSIINDTSFIESVEKSKRFAIIGIGIDQKDIPSHFKRNRNKLYPNFESVQQDDFLDGIFTNVKDEMEEEIQTHENSPVEHEMEEENLTNEKLPDEHGIEEVKPSQVKSPVLDEHEVTEQNHNSGRSSGCLMWIKTALHEPKVIIIIGILSIAGLYRIAPYWNIHDKYIAALEFIFEYYLPFPFRTFFGHLRNYPVEDEQ